MHLNFFLKWTNESFLKWLNLKYRKHLLCAPGAHWHVLELYTRTITRIIDLKLGGYVSTDLVD